MAEGTNRFARKRPDHEPMPLGGAAQLAKALLEESRFKELSWLGELGLVYAALVHADWNGVFYLKWETWGGAVGATRSGIRKAIAPAVESGLLQTQAFLRPPEWTAKGQGANTFQFDPRLVAAPRLGASAVNQQVDPSAPPQGAPTEPSRQGGDEENTPARVPQAGHPEQKAFNEELTSTMTAVDRELLEAMLAAFNLHPSQNRLAEAAFAEHRDGFGRAVIAALSGNARSPEAVLTAALKAGAHNQPGAGTFGDAYRLATGKPVPGSDDDPEAWEHEHEFWFYNRYADVLDESGGYAEPNAVYYNALEAERAREAVPGSWVQEIAVRRRRDGDRQTKGS